MCPGRQDKQVLDRVYEQINEWRQKEGVEEVIREPDLEKIVQDEGHVHNHPEHQCLSGRAFSNYLFRIIISCALHCIYQSQIIQKIFIKLYS